MKKLQLAASVAATLLFASTATHAFTYIADYKMTVVDRQLTYHVDIAGVSESGISWNDGFDQAANNWSGLTPVSVNTVRQYADPCSIKPAGIGGVAFTGNLCGYLDTNNLLAATAITMYSVYAHKASPHYEADIKATDIPFNHNFRWDIYSGPVRSHITVWPNGHRTADPIIDFRRVAAHELGHSLGLGHSIFNHSIMKASTGDTDSLSIDDICGVSVLHGQPELCPIWLRHPVTVSGKPTSAVFVGGASADGGLSYADYFRRADSIDVMATVVVEDGHWNKTGRLHVVVELSDGTTLIKTDDGFINWDGSVQALKTTALTHLSGANEIYILKNFDLTANNISNIGVAMYVGYSLDSEPEEVYYSGTPIMFRVE